MNSSKQLQGFSKHTQFFKSSDNFRFCFGSSTEDFSNASSGGESSSSSIADPTEPDGFDQIEHFTAQAYPQPRTWNSPSCVYNASYMNSTDTKQLCFVVENAVTIVANTPNKILKAVELANMLRKKVGRKQLARVKELCGGLLFLLERYSQIFIVHRIPKKDMVQLASNYLAKSNLFHIYQQAHAILSLPNQASIPFLDIDQLISDVDDIFEESYLYCAPFSEPSVALFMDSFEPWFLPAATYSTV